MGLAILDMGTHFVNQTGLEPAIFFLSLPRVGVTGTTSHHIYFDDKF